MTSPGYVKVDRFSGQVIAVSTPRRAQVSVVMPTVRVGVPGFAHQHPEYDEVIVSIDPATGVPPRDGMIWVQVSP